MSMLFAFLNCAIDNCFDYFFNPENNTSGAHNKKSAPLVDFLIIHKSLLVAHIKGHAPLAFHLLVAHSSFCAPLVFHYQWRRLDLYVAHSVVRHM